MRVLCAFIVNFMFAIVHYDLFFSFMLTDEWNAGADEFICIVIETCTPLIRVVDTVHWGGKGTCSLVL